MNESVQTSQTQDQQFMPVWLRLFPFFLSAFLFLSVFFTLFAPLPLLSLAIRTNIKKVALALAVNTAIVLFLGGPSSACFFVTFVGGVVLALPYCLFTRNFSVNKSVAVTVVSIIFSVGVIFSLYCMSQQIAPMVWLEQQVQVVFDQVLAVSAGDSTKLFGGLPPEVAKKNLIQEFPSTLFIFSLIMVWVNFLMLFKFSPLVFKSKLNLDFTFLKTWRAPDYLVWPTILSGATLLIDMGTLSLVGLNVFKVLLSIYAIQGLSVLSYFLDHWKVTGMLRSAGYLIVVFLVTPFLLALGFFDFWFNFRSKVKST